MRTRFAFAAAALLTLVACGTSTEETPATSTDAASTSAAEAPEATAAPGAPVVGAPAEQPSDTLGAPPPAPPADPDPAGSAPGAAPGGAPGASTVERNPADFTEAEPTDPFAAYAVELKPGTYCLYYSGGEYFSCTVKLDGALPPLDPGYGAPDGQHPDVLMFEEGTGFMVTHSTGGGEGNPPVVPLLPGERVTTGAYTFEHRADGSVRAERGAHWFEISPTGQYTSDRFAP